MTIVKRQQRKLVGNSNSSTVTILHRMNGILCLSNVIVTFALMQFAMEVSALVPHSFWNGASKSQSQRLKMHLSFSSGHYNRRRSFSSSTMTMYFDDCEREDNVKPLQSSNDDNNNNNKKEPWIMSLSEEKHLAMNRLLGFNYQSTLKLDPEQIEDEILQWAIDTNVLWIGQDEQEQEQDQDQYDENKYKYNSKERCKFTKLSDLTIESSSTTLEDSMTRLWEALFQLLENQNKQKGNGAAAAVVDDDVHWLVFPNCPSLWDYDTMVTLLQAMQLCRSQIVIPNNHNNEKTIQIDLFHPKYKNAPTMFSPETHSPFPLVSLQIKNNNNNNNYNGEDDELAMTRSKLEALFDSFDAVDIPNKTSSSSSSTKTPSFPTTHASSSLQSNDKILQDCQLWFDHDIDNEDSMMWKLETESQPYHVYTQLWKLIRSMENAHSSKNAITKSKSSSSSAMLIAPNMDAHTLHRVAVTVNLALQKFNSRISIVNVYHPNIPKQDSLRKSPHAMIQLAYK